jgi:hypothetical protein
MGFRRRRGETPGLAIRHLEQRLSNGRDSLARAAARLGRRRPWCESIGFASIGLPGIVKRRTRT